MPLQYRAEFDAVVTFRNGGGLQAQGFRVDVPHADVTEPEIASLFVTACRLLMVDRVELSGVRIFAEPHLGTPGGPSEPRTRFVELSHVIGAGTITYPGLPAPEITPHLTREASRGVYAEGTEFAIDRISMVGNTGTYLDSPFHRYADGTDLAGLPLERLAGLPAVVVRAVGGARGVGVDALEHLTVAGHAVLLHTGGDAHWGTPAYAEDAPFLTEAGARWLVDHGAALVGIDAVNIDDASPAGGGARPAHTLLLAAGIPVVEHLTGLADLPPTGARFTAAPPRVSGFGTFPVRAYATVPELEPHDHRTSGGWQPTAG
ncbi:cyclase family protein [Couchioplanes caeruleus]|uniref:cyclase family protein n=1 Tax=Couchioplanes caeruleus TaxID=56438 RepID=UPI0020BEEAAB|nr:cyclase family protein [Couchioplanes caeruleus]UQU64449.1 cyclase family protein [Couchioplanes caeruleus]